MKIPFLFILTVSLITEANAQLVKDDFITIGRKVSINSSILNEKRTLYVYLPVGYDNFGNKKYPVAYLLDGGWNFEGFIGIVHHLSEALGNKLLPRMIVIGILNTDRTRGRSIVNYTHHINAKRKYAAGIRIFKNNNCLMVLKVSYQYGRKVVF